MEEISEDGRAADEGPDELVIRLITRWLEALGGGRLVRLFHVFLEHEKNTFFS